MKNFASLLAIPLVGITSTIALGDGSTTDGIACAGFPGKFTYQRAKSVNRDQTGEYSCDIVEVPTSNSKIAPLDNEMTHIFRGPLNLLQFAVYTQSSPSKPKMKRGPRMSTHERRHGHAHQHFHEHAKEARDEKEKRYWVTATINGQVQSWTQDYGEGVTPATPAPVSAPAAHTPAAAPAADSKGSTPSTASSGSALSPAPSVSVNAGDWTRKAYFSADKQTAEGIAFTANNNMTVPALGFLPGWVAPNGMDKADSPSILGKDGYIPDNYEVLVHSNVQCNDPSMSACPVVTPGSIAHHGWGGDRIILAEFKMPRSSCTTNCKNQFTGGNLNPDQPAWWSLSSETINVAQYGFSFESQDSKQGDPSCSGWLSGAGELDIHEIADHDNLETGFTSFHMGQHYSGTPPQGWKRPSQGGSMKMAVITAGDTFKVQLLPDSMDFAAALDDSTVAGWLGCGKGAGGQAKVLAGTQAKYAGSLAEAPVFNVLLHA